MTAPVEDGERLPPRPDTALVVPEVEAEESTGAVVRHGATMAVGSIVSRITGFLRTAAIGAAIGAAAVADDYNAANTLPNMVYELLLGGVLASAIVPLLVRARTNDTDRGEAYTQRLLTLATVFLGSATVLAVLAAPVLTRLLTNPRTTPQADQRLITVLGYLLLPEIFFYGMAALFAAVLNTRGHFAAPMWAPILNNIVVIATAFTFMLLPSVQPLDAATLSTAQLAVLGIGTTLGIVVQATGLVPALRKVGFRWRWRWDFRELHLGELARISGWMLLYVAVSQVAVIAALKTAKAAGDLSAPGPAIYLNAFLIFMMAHGIVAVSIMTALMPRMSAAAAQRRHGDLADQLSSGTRLASVVLLPATAGYVVLGVPLAMTLFRYGNYTQPQAVATGWVIALAGLGLLPFAISQLQIFAFYAMPDTKTPALINIPVVIVRVALYLLAWFALDPQWVCAGLMAANGVSYALTVVLGYWLLRRRIGRLGVRQVADTVGRLGLATVIASVPTAVVVFAIHQWYGDGRLSSIVQLAAGGLVLVLVYVGASLVLRVREVRELSTMVRGRLGR